jgi:5-methylcytosine-specific restriction endonuclease McrA
MLGDCKICNRELTWNTLDNHQGVCGRCYKKSKTSKKEKKRVKFTKTDRSIVWHEYKTLITTNNNKCLLCNSNSLDSFNFEIGHDVAVANGGLNNISNVMPICRMCNSSQGTKTFAEFQLSMIRNA